MFRALLQPQDVGLHERLLTILFMSDRADFVL